MSTINRDLDCVSGLLMVGGLPTRWRLQAHGHGQSITPEFLADKGFPVGKSSPDGGLRASEKTFDTSLMTGVGPRYLSIVRKLQMSTCLT